jgi:hypothetical protein
MKFTIMGQISFTLKMKILKVTFLWKICHMFPVRDINDLQDLLCKRFGQYFNEDF